MKKNVLFFEGNPKVGFGGGQRISLEVARCFEEEGLKIFFVNFGTENNFFDQMSLLSKDAVSLRRENIFLVFITLILFVKRNYLNTENTFIYSAIKSGDAIGILLKILFGFKVVSHVHMMKEALNSFSQIIASYFYSIVDYTLVVSKSVERSWKLENSFLILNPVRKNFLKDKEREGNINKLAMVGHIIKSKGIERFLDDFYKEIESQGIKLYIWGDGSDCKRLKEKYPRVHWQGFVKNLNFELSKCDLLVFPSIVPEAFGLAIVEAAQLGIPSISSNLGGQAEVTNSLFGAECLYDLEKKSSFWECFYKVKENYKYLSNIGVENSHKLYSVKYFKQSLREVISTV